MRFLQYLVCGVAIGIAAAANAAEPAELHVRFVTNSEPHLVRGTLKLISVTTKEQEEVPLSADNVTLKRPASSMWTLELVSESSWAAPRVVTLPAAGTLQDENWDVWAVGTITATSKQEGAAVTVTTDAPPAGLPQPAVPGGLRLACSVDDARRTVCAAPATAIDVVFRSGGCVPVYRTIHVSTGMNDLGELPCQQGASLVAWIDPKTMRTASEALHARLYRMVESGPAVGDRLRTVVAEAGVAGNGRVQLAPLPAGTYVLEVSAKPFAPARAFPLEIHDGRESVLRKPISLDLPLTARVLVQPRQDDRGKPWRVELRRESDVSAAFDAALVLYTDRTGRAKADGQSPGLYRIAISDSAGNVFHRTEAKLTAATTDINVSISMTTVRGRVILGEKPLPATLWFGTQHGSESVSVRTDAEGHFETSLPRAGEWLLEFDSSEPKSHGVMKVHVASAELLVNIPFTNIGGTVLREDGSSAANVEVSALSGAVPVSTTTGADGSFRFQGISPGDVHLHARDLRTGQQSVEKTINLKEGDSASDVVLTLQQILTVTGQAVSRGAPVIGARISGYSFLDGRAVRVNAASDEQGRFELKFPVASSKATIVVAAPAKTLQSYVVDLDGKPLLLDVQPHGGTIRLHLPESSGMFPTLFQAGAVLMMPDVLGWARAHGETPQSGWLNIPNLAPAAYRACAPPASPSERVKCAEGSLVPGATLTLNLTQ